MLVFKRGTNTSLLITDGSTEMKIHVLSLYKHEKYGRMVKLGFEIPQSMKIWREELYYAEKMQVSLDDARVMLKNARLAEKNLQSCADDDYALPGL